MKFLSKIVFINSADKALKYAEIELDGNVHFIGTQGVGKSTLLRAILFFYSADTQKLGIPREKKNYNEYYFPYQNSYIIYEVKTETGKFCVLSFKSQGRTAFRFIDTEYDKKYFIAQDGKAFENWDKTRDALGKIQYTKIINSYEEYRNILYGNNKGLGNEVRKYALLESKQYQNIPRTIANVFLNAKLDAEFVKETIIKSLNEEEIKIDLTTYSQAHLKDFETNLNDVKKWTEVNVLKQADRLNSIFSALKFLELQKKELASELGYSLNKLYEMKPKAQEHLNSEEVKLERCTSKLNELQKLFEDKRATVQKQLGEVSGKLKEITTKKKYYEEIKIETIINRVVQKNTLETKIKNLENEKNILTSKFFEIQQRFDAQLKQLANQLKEFENNKQTEKNNIYSNFISYKENIYLQYDKVYEEIRRQHDHELATANDGFNENQKNIAENNAKLSEIKGKQFFMPEITNCKNEISICKDAISKADVDITVANNNIKIIQKEWELEIKNCNGEANKNTNIKKEEQQQLNKEYEAINMKIKNSKDSFYGWLNDNFPNWEKTIGKVIDEENVLYQHGLNPIKSISSNNNLFGIEIDLNSIKKDVKTVADLQSQQERIKSQIEQIRKEIVHIQTQHKEDEEKLKRKFHPKIKEQKDIIQQANFGKAGKSSILETSIVQLSEWENKAKKEKRIAIESVENRISELNELKLKSEEVIIKIKKGIEKSIEAKKKEKDLKIRNEQDKINITIKLIDSQVQDEKDAIHSKIEAIKSEQFNELHNKGADTKQLKVIEAQLNEIKAELKLLYMKTMML